MADVQKEGGYTPIAHGILEALARQALSPDEWRVLMVIFRKTYGWDKKWDRISNQQFSDMTGIARNNIPRILNRLVGRKMVMKSVISTDDRFKSVISLDDRSVISGHDRYITTYGFQKDYDLWCHQHRRHFVENESVISIDPKVSSAQMHTKDILTKENNKALMSDPSGVLSPDNTQDSSKPSVQDLPNPASAASPKKKTVVDNPDAFRLAELLLVKILERKPNFRRPDLKAWASTIDRIIRFDKRTVEGVQGVIEWCQQDDFWRNNILSAGKLREKLDTLELRMEEKGFLSSTSPRGSPGGPKKPGMLEKIKAQKEELKKEKILKTEGVK